ncbi:MAG: ferritin [Armatimonadetes bacterium]|nr:ferritin [Armatimonadota bacterium]
MLSKAVEGAINEQIKNELYSGYLYLSMAAHFESVNLPGFAAWMRVQHQEETAHAMKLFDYVNDRGGRVILQAIEQPPSDFQSPLSIFEQVLAHEQQVTATINGLYEVASSEKDYTTLNALQWFLAEQVEEEKNATLVLAQLKMIGEHSTALVMVDRHMGKRE